MIATLNRSAVTPNFRALVDSKSTAVKRCLFGEPDHSQIRSELKKQLSDIAVRDAQRWNFDFGSFAPLVGRYDWEPVPIASTSLNAVDSTKNSTSTATEANVNLLCMELRSGRQCVDNKLSHEDGQSTIIGNDLIHRRSIDLLIERFLDGNFH